MVNCLSGIHQQCTPPKLYDTDSIKTIDLKQLTASCDFLDLFNKRIFSIHVKRAIARDNDQPFVVSEHIRNKRSKHQYENLSLGANFPFSVVPKSEYLSSISTGMIFGA